MSEAMVTRMNVTTPRAPPSSRSSSATKPPRNGTYTSVNTAAVASMTYPVTPPRSRHSMQTRAVTAVAVTSAGAPKRNAASTITMPPAITGSRVMRMFPVAKAWASSQTATRTAATTMSMNAGFQNASETITATPRTTPEAIAAHRLRPARLVLGGEGVGAGGVSGALMGGRLRPRAARLPCA
jgi:hypothetical protein